MYQYDLLEFVKNPLQIEITFPNKDTRERQLIHELAEKMCLESKSYDLFGTNLKDVVVTKINNPILFESFNDLDEQIVEFFVKFSRLPISLYTPAHILYFIKILNRNFDSERMFDLFIDDLKKFQSFKKFKNHVYDVKSEIIKFIKESTEFIEFNERTFEIPNIKQNKNIYSKEFAGKHYVSIDVKSANFTTLCYYCKSFEKDWKVFLSKFTNSEFIKNSKQFREITFGDLGCKKLSSLPLIFINKVHNSISEFYGLIKKVFCSDDEIVYQIDNPNTFPISKFTTLVNNLESTEGFFHIKFFKLVQIGNIHQYFIKEYTDKSYKNEFRNVPKKIFMQCMKFYYDEQQNDLDRKFIDDNGEIATYDNPYTF